MDILLGQYKGLKATIPVITYTEDDVNAQIGTLLAGNPTRVNKEGPVAMGDTAVIDYEGFKDGVPFDGGKAEKYPLGIGSGAFIPGFEEQIVGMEIGEDRDINLSFPEQYHYFSVELVYAFFESYRCICCGYTDFCYQLCRDDRGAFDLSGIAYIDWIGKAGYKVSEHYGHCCYGHDCGKCTHLSYGDNCCDSDYFFKYVRR